MSEEKPIRIAVDIGGTFTDLQIHDARSGQVYALKTPSTPTDPSVGLITGIRKAAARCSFSMDQIGRILHGSTIATNAVLERKLPKCALITTKGFEDVLAIGRHMRKDVYALKAEPRSLLVPKDLRFGVSERVLASGKTETQLNEAQVRDLGENLLNFGVEAVAIVFLHAYRNPENELRAKAILNEIAPDLCVTTSCETSPEIREYERCSTTVLNAALQPVISGYLEKVGKRLHDAGITAPLYLVQSNGGVVSPDDAARMPAKLLLSGPAGGAIAMANLAECHEDKNLVGIDMGGTSSDVSLVIDGRVGVTTESEIAGLAVRLPMIEIRTIGAGGGSLARVEAGALRVGPESAGAQPGPVSYGNGGTQPTVTDANVALGRIDPDAFLGGEMTLDVRAARDAFDQQITDQLELDQETAAEGTLSVANAHMAGTVRLSLFEKGADPADFTLVPFGGAAGLHACSIARDLGMEKIIFPADASTMSARGILDADLRWDFSRSCLLIASVDNLSQIFDAVDGLLTAALTKLEAEEVGAGDGRIELACDLRYRGQAYEITTPWPEAADGEPVTSDALAAVLQRFHQLHETRYSYATPDDPVELVTLRAVAVGELQKGPTTGNFIAPVLETAARRAVHIDDEWQNIKVHSRSAIMENSDGLEGPLLVAEEYTVLFIEPGWTLKPLAMGALVATWEGGV